jgi:4-hydroxybenzoate polyprenyltransferase
MEDDALVGVKSSARRLGASAPAAILAFYALCALLAAAAGLSAGLGPLFWPMLALYALQLFWQARRVRVDDGALALRLFKSNRAAGLILFLAFIAGAWRSGGLG